MSSPEIRVFTCRHTHTNAQICSRSVSKQIKTTKRNQNTSSLYLLLSTHCQFHPLRWLVSPLLYSCSQSVSRTNAPALLASGLCSSAMQQHTQIHKHTHILFLFASSQHLTLIQCWVHLPGMLTGESWESVCQAESRERVCVCVLGWGRTEPTLPLKAEGGAEQEEG